MVEGKPDMSAGAAPLFGFAVVADTHVNPEDGCTSSPWRTNRLANARARTVVAQINAFHPEFVIHLGDLVHPVPSHPGYAAAALRFRALFAELRAPLHLVAGNHDMGDKPTPWMPAASVNARFLELYRAHFGKDFYAFDHGGCRFVVLNSQILNSGFADERAQWAWLEEQLATHERVFLFKHYPPFVCDEDEDEHYDNVAEPARSRLLALIRRHPVEALFCGHVHNFFYNRIGAVDCYVLPATSAVRHDYMELFPVAPAGDEHGRDARAKLGFFWVEVYARGHVAHWIRSWGETEPARAVAGLKRPKVHARGATVAPIGVDLRHGWAEAVAIPYTGAVDEFGRKRARNDYLLAALWEMGVKRLRVPLQDLIASETAARVATLAALGHRFLVFTFGLPDARQRSRLARFAACLDGVEIIERGSMLRMVAPLAASLRSELGVPVFLSKLRVSAETASDAGRFAHFIRHGFVTDEPDAAALLTNTRASSLDGLAFRVERATAPWAPLHAVAEAARAADRRAVVHVRLADDDPAEDASDDAATARRVADAALAAWAHGDRLAVYLDTFADHDRGYYPRHGLIDRACDPRPASAVLRHLVERLCDVDWRGASIIAEGAARIIRAPGLTRVVLLPDLEHNARGLPWPASLPAVCGPVDGVGLDTGAPIRATLRAARGRHRLEGDGVASGMPILIGIPHTAPTADAKEAVTGA
jgi:predicted phosphodiesterase